MNFQFDFKFDLDAYATTISFNKKGTLLAVGLNNGRIYIIDFTSHFTGDYRILFGHVYPITSLDWSKHGDKLISGSTDYKIVIWNIETEERDFILRFPSQISKVQFHPEDHRQFLVCQMFRNPVYYYKMDVMHGPLPIDDPNDSFNMIAEFCGKKYIMTGSSKGSILLISFENFQIIASFKLKSAIRGFHFRENGDFLVTSDYVIRIYNLEVVIKHGLNKDLQPKKMLFNIVDKQTNWKVCGFSSDGEYICSAGKTFIYIWDTLGGINTILENSFKNTILDIKWHPALPIIVSIHGGELYVWGAKNPAYTVQNWTEYFGSRLQLIDNTVEYEERESEFDFSDEDASFNDEILNESSESDEIDVCSVDEQNCFVMDMTPTVNGLNDEILNKSSDVEIDVCSVDEPNGFEMDMTPRVNGFDNLENSVDHKVKE